MDIVMQELFGTGTGLLSLFVIAFLIFMAAFLFRMYYKKSHSQNPDEQEHCDHSQD